MKNQNRYLASLFALGAIFLALTPAVAQEDPSDRGRPSKIPPARSNYMGRQIARTMHYTGAEWLIRDEREREERCSMMIANLGIKPGMTICDMGCGNGFHTLRMAELTGKDGIVLGVDVQSEMLEYLRDRGGGGGREKKK